MRLIPLAGAAKCLRLLRLWRGYAPVAASTCRVCEALPADPVRWRWEVLTDTPIHEASVRPLLIHESVYSALMPASSSRAAVSVGADSMRAWPAGISR